MLTWGASTDNVGTVGYKISRNNTVIKTISGTSLTDSGLSPGAQYTYGVVAFDAANNLSQPSNTTITTLTSSSSPVTPSPSLIFSQSAQSISN